MAKDFLEIIVDETKLRENSEGSVIYQPDNNHYLEYGYSRWGCLKLDTA